MIIKKYIADTEAEAVDAAKKELGQGIVIMNVRNIKRKGIARFFKNPRKEVTVALEEESERVSSAVRDIARVVKESEPVATADVQKPKEQVAKPAEAVSVRKDVMQEKEEKTKASEKENEAEIISDMEARLAYLRRDTSGANQQEIKQLEEQLGDARESYSDTLVDQQLQKLSDENEKAEEQRQQ